MRCEVLAVGTELLLGPSVDTNSTWIGERLAESGIDSHFHTVVGDNLDRIVEAMRIALSRADALIVTGGLGPTQDDITRDAAAVVMDDPLITDEAQVERIRALFVERRREMAANNLRQAMRPSTASAIVQDRGTAPGLRCPVGGDKVMYLLPGVPWEMKEMLQRAVLPDLRARAGASAVIRSRFLRTWGIAESTLDELVAPRLAALEEGGSVTLAFLAHGIDGVFIRITAKAPTSQEADSLLDAEEAQLRTILGMAVFGVDDETMEQAVGSSLGARGLQLAVAESLTGGLVAQRLTDAIGASEWFRGGVVSYASEVKYEVLRVAPGPVVAAKAAVEMAEGVRSLLRSDVGLSLTGVAGPAEQEGQPVGTVFIGLAAPWGPPEVLQLHLSGERQRIREFACAHALDLLRRRLSEQPLP